MIKAADGKIGTREFTSIILLSIGIKLSDTTPNLYFVEGGNAAWILPIISFVVIGVPFFILLSLLKKHDAGLMELLSNLTGKYVSGIIGLCLFLIMLNGTAINSRAYIDIVNTMFYPKTPIPILLFLLLAFSFLIAKRGFETIGRTAWLILPILEVILLTLIIFVWKDTNWTQIFPIAGPGMEQILKASVTHSSVFGDVILLAAFFSFVRSYEDYRFSSLFGLGLSCFKIAVFLALYTAVFDYPEVSSMAFPFQQLTRIANFGEIITHVEAIYFGFWMISVVIHFSIHLYLTAYFFAGALRLAKFEPLILPMAGLTLFIGLLPENILQINGYKEMLIKSSSVLLISLPFILLIVDRWKGWDRS